MYTEFLCTSSSYQKVAGGTQKKNNPNFPFSLVPCNSSSVCSAYISDFSRILFKKLIAQQIAHSPPFEKHGSILTDSRCPKFWWRSYTAPANWYPVYPNKGYFLGSFAYKACAAQHNYGFFPKNPNSPSVLKNDSCWFCDYKSCSLKLIGLDSVNHALSCAPPKTLFLRVCRRHKNMGSVWCRGKASVKTIRETLSPLGSNGGDLPSHNLQTSLI